jgi:protein required for attachment to host cells
MNICVIAADGGRARLFVYEEPAGAPARLVERESLVNAEYDARGTEAMVDRKSTRMTNREAGPMHPQEPWRDQHRAELERRFAANIAERVTGLVKGWKDGSIVLVADPKMLGLAREGVRAVGKGGVSVKELAKDYTGLSPHALHQQLAGQGLLPAPKRAGA